jgi:hypothetical protein
MRELTARTLQFGVVAIACWAFLIYKLNHLRTDPRNRFLAAFCSSIAAVTLSMTMALPPVLSRLEQSTGVLALWTNVPAILMCPASLLTVQLWAYPAGEAWRKMRWHVTLYAAVLAAMIGLGLRGMVNPVLVNIPAHAQEPELLYGSLPYVRELILLYFATLIYTDTILTWLFWRHASFVDRRWLQRGLRLLALAAAVSVASYVTCAIMLIGLRVSMPMPVAERVWAPLSGLGVLIAAVGGTMPVLGPRIDCLRAYRRLHPLWRALSKAHPDILLDQPSRLDRWNPWRINYRLYRRVIEIRDGWLALRPYMTRLPTLPASLRNHGDGDDQDRQAAVTAAALATALHVRAAGGTPHQDPVQDNGMGGHDLTTEIAWLSRVARKFALLSNGAGTTRDPATAPQSLS